MEGFVVSGPPVRTPERPSPPEQELGAVGHPHKALTMGRLSALKPTLQPMGDRLTQQTGMGWRAGKTTNDRGYTYAWQQARARFLAEHPLCEFCKARGVVELAEVVDHKVPHRGDMALFWDETNWQALSKRCHDSEKARQERTR
jgi:5-methylcytosine-specific restriction protein A